MFVEVSPYVYSCSNLFGFSFPVQTRLAQISTDSDSTQLIISFRAIIRVKIIGFSFIWKDNAFVDCLLMYKAKKKKN